MTTSGASLLTTDTEAPAMTETTVSTHLPQALEGLAHLVVEQISIYMGCLAVLDIFLSVYEPRRHELQGNLDDCDDFIDLLRSELASTAVTQSKKSCV